MMENVDKINSFEYNNVTLKNSHWQKQREETIELYLNISNDDLLHLFRKKAGIPSDVNGLAGWYGSSAHSFGQKLGAFAKLYCTTGDYRLKEKAFALVDEWMICVDKCSDLLKNGTYVYEKLMGGLLDVYEYLHYEKVLTYVSKLTDYAIANFKTDIKRDGLQDSELSGNNMIEWYTLPENLYRAYEFTNEKKYFDFAKEWDYNYFWDKLNNKDFLIGPRHAYSHVNSLSSAARAYEVTRDKKYLSAIEIAYDEILSHHTFATGGYGPAESIFVDKDGYMGDSLKSTWDETLGSPMYRSFYGAEVTRNDTWGSCEVSCCAWAVFKLCNYLLKYTGDAKYGDWAEKMLYNGTGGQIPIKPDGSVMYYANYFIDGAIKTTEDRRLQADGYPFEWQCCTGTFPQDVAEYSNMLYYYDEESIYVSQYLPSKLLWEKNSNRIIIESYSLYPQEKIIQFCIHCDNEISFNFKFRVPSWATGENKIKVNGKSIQLNMQPNTWAVINRKWKDNDLISIEFEFPLYFKPVDGKNSDIMALCYGPITLAADKMTDFTGDAKNPGDWIKPVDEKNYIFETKPGHVKGYDFIIRKFKPYYALGSMQWYYMYNRVE